MTGGGQRELQPARRPGSNAQTQRARLLEEMRRRRDTGAPGWISGRDFRAPTCDGGPEMHNITPRISELRGRHHIVTERGQDGTAYRLAWDLGDDGAPLKQLVDDAREAARSTDDLPDCERQFDPGTAPARPLNAALCDFEDEAA